MNLNGIYNLYLFNIAMENGRRMICDDFPQLS